MPFRVHFLLVTISYQWIDKSVSIHLFITRTKPFRFRVKTKEAIQ